MLEKDRTKYLQKKGLELLEVFHDFCEQNNLKYILDFGTLLGAVRHQGFIPWDDDIDVAMPRDDYDKLIRIITEKGLKNDLFFQTHETDLNYYFLFSKIRIKDDRFVEESLSHFDIITGPWLDIFPYDFIEDIDSSLTKEKLERVSKSKKVFQYTTPLLYPKTSFFDLKTTFKNTGKKIVKNCIMISQRNKNRGIVMKYLDQKYDETVKIIKELFPSQIANKSDYKMIHLSETIDYVNPEKNIFLSYQDFIDREKVPFEHLELYISKNFEQILTQRYGDFMKLPKQSERKSNHTWK